MSISGCMTPCFVVMLNNGDGTFQPPVFNQPAAAIYPFGFADFNGDGKLDIAGGGCSPYQPCVMGFLWGDGDGTFQDGPTYEFTWGPGSGAVADFNNDGNLDFAAADLGNIGATLLSKGNGTFDGPFIFDAGGYYMQAADFNGDGNQDLAFSIPNPSSSAGVALGNGNGTFQTEVAYPVGKTASQLVVGDFNNDHQLDLIVADQTSTNVYTLLNTGVVSFTPTTAATFANQLVGTTSKPQTVTLTNTGVSALSISSIKATGQFTMTNTCPSSVPPGGNCSITVTFAPQTKGTQYGTVSIVDSASIKPEVIDLVGAATLVSLSPAALNFPPQKLHTTSQPMTSTLTNHGSTPLTFTSFKFQGEWGEYSQTNTCGTQIAAGASCVITVWFTPVYTGKQTAVLQISDNGGGSPQGLYLSGIGTN